MKKYYINLNHRHERAKLANREFRKLGWDVERFEAIKKTPGWEGCRLSHLALLDKCKHEQTFAIFEDDVVFMPDANENLKNAMGQLPYDWDMLLLGCNPLVKLEQYSENLYRLKKSYTTHAMIFNSPSMVEFILNEEGGGRKIDVFYTDVVYEKFNCFVTWPLVAAQRNGASDICTKVEQTFYFDTITQNFKKFTR